MRAFLNIILLLVALPAMAANSITPGTVSIVTTFEEIGVTANYSGDDDADATFHVRWKKTAGTVWFNAYYHTNHIDRRATVGGFDNSAQRYQGRLSIVGCSPNTSYDVVCIWTDADGGSASITNTVSTQGYASTRGTNGTILYVDAAAGSEGSGSSGSPYKTITNALALCSAGDTILVARGEYTPFIWTKSGTPTAFIFLRSITNGATISGGAVTSNLFLQASNLVIDGISFGTARTNCIQTSASARNIFIQNCNMTNISSGWAIASADTYAINLESRTNIYLLTNVISGSSSAQLQDMHLVRVGGGGPAVGCVIADNEIYRSGWDGIGGGGNYGPGNGFRESTIARNHIYDCHDDMVEGDGDGINLRIHSGYFHTALTPDGSGLSMAPIHCGPAYVYRSIINTTNIGALKQGNNSGPNSGPVFYFQNDFCTDNSGGGGWEATGQGGGSTKSQNDTFLNNIFNAQGNTVYLGTSTNNFWNYNVHRSTSAGVGGSIVYHFNETTTDYTLTTWRSTFGFDLNGLDAHPGISNIVTGQLTNGSPAMNAGTVITNFNDSSSAWPFEGAAPDIGAHEFFATRDSDGETNAYAVTATIAPGARKPGRMQ